MSSNENNNNPSDMSRSQRRGSIAAATFGQLFRSNSTSQGTSVFPGPITTAALNDQRRRLSISTLGIAGTSPTSTTSSTFGRRASLSTNNSDAIDENAVDEDDYARTVPTTPYARRMSFGAQAAMRVRGSAGGSPKTNTDQGFSWSEQLRSRAESTVATGVTRPSFSFVSGKSASPRSSPPSIANGSHDRSKSVSDMPAPPSQVPRAKLPKKPDQFQERILKGDFYMD